MRIVAVVGSESNSGKTTVACRILKGVPGLGAVKISRREGDAAHVEWDAGPTDKDTARYAASGATVVARIIGPEASLVGTWEKIRGAFSQCPAVVIEGRGAIELPEEKYVIFVVGPKVGLRLERNLVIAALSDVIVVWGPTHGATGGELAEILSHSRRGVPIISASIVSAGDEGGEEIVERVQRWLL